MSARRREVIYVLTDEDVEGIFSNEYGEGAWAKLNATTRRVVIREARSYVESFCGAGSYTWADAIADSLRESVPDMKRGPERGTA